MRTSRNLPAPGSKRTKLCCSLEKIEKFNPQKLARTLRAYATLKLLSRWAWLTAIAFPASVEKIWEFIAQS